MNLLSKSLITIFSTILLSQGLNAKTTTCYKNNWRSPSNIETTKLDGGECNSNFSYEEMLKKGWVLKDINIKKGENGLNYSYILSNEKSINITNSKIIDNSKTKLNFKPFGIRIHNIKDDTAKINIGNLKIGQSAIIQHNYPNKRSLIVSNAYVEATNSLSSTLKFIPFLDIKQNAIPTSNRKPINGDIAILNYLYYTSLIIAPSQDAFLVTRNKYKKNNFLHSDIFAAKLKSEKEPLPSRKTIQNFAISQNIGTLFFIIENKIYIVDSKTFKILDTDHISYDFTQEGQLPFYTRIEKIEKSALKSTFNYKTWLSSIDNVIGDDKRTEEEQLLEDEIEADKLSNKDKLYNNYYEKLLGIKK